MKCVYKISSVNDDIKEFYIGSTEDFNRRVKYHESAYNSGCDYKVYTFIRENGGLNTWDICPIEIIDFPISTEELRQYEQGYLDKYKPELNSQRAFGIDLEQRKLYKRQNGIEYREKNKEKIKKSKLTPLQCPHCDKMITRCNLAGHIRKWCKGSTLL